MNKEYIKEKQPILYNLFSNAKSKNKMPHLLLLYGEPSCNLLDIAFYLAKSINCPNDTFACNNCVRCTKFDKEIRPDFVFIDGDDHIIKKPEIDELQKHFQYGAIENNTTVVYILNEIQNITSEASNSLLKFLEEPKVNTLAILTSSNISKVLPTIHSRSTLIHILNDKDIYNDILKITNNTKQSYIISKLTGSKQKITELSNSIDFLDIVDTSLSFVKSLETSTNKASFILLNEVSKNYKQSSKSTLLYKVLTIILTEAINTNNKNNIFELAKEKLVKLKNKILNIINLLNETINKQIANLNTTGIIGQINTILLN